MKKATRWAELRRAAGMTQIELAQKLGVSDMTVYRWEREGAQPKIEILPIMAQALKTSTDYLLGLTDDPTPARRASGSITQNVNGNLGAVTQTGNINTNIPRPGLQRLDDVKTENPDGWNLKVYDLSDMKEPMVLPSPFVPWWASLLTSVYKTILDNDSQELKNCLDVTRKAVDLLEQACSKHKVPPTSGQTEQDSSVQR